MRIVLWNNVVQVPGKMGTYVYNQDKREPYFESTTLRVDDLITELDTYSNSVRTWRVFVRYEYAKICDEENRSTPRTGYQDQEVELREIHSCDHNGEEYGSVVRVSSKCICDACKDSEEKMKLLDGLETLDLPYDKIIESQSIEDVEEIK